MNGSWVLNTYLGLYFPYKQLNNLEDTIIILIAIHCQCRLEIKMLLKIKTVQVSTFHCSSTFFTGGHLLLSSNTGKGFFCLSDYTSLSLSLFTPPSDDWFLVNICNKTASLSQSKINTTWCI